MLKYYSTSEHDLMWIWGQRRGEVIRESGRLLLQYDWCPY